LLLIVIGWWWFVFMVQATTLLSDVDVHFLSTIAIVNKIVIPCVAISFVNSNCFFYTIFAPPAVTAQATSCLNLGTIVMCYNMLGSHANGDVTYNPPFIYSYECSAFFLRDYTPVFVFMCVWMSLLCPAIWFGLQKLQHHLDSRRAGMDDWRVRWQLTLVRVCLPQNWKSYDAAFDSDPESIRTTRSRPIINSKQRCFIRTNNFLSVLLSFGVVFPPLACMVFVSVLVMQYFECVNFVRLQYECARNDNLSAMRNHAVECAGILRQVADVSVGRMMLWLSSLLFGFVLFDTLGDVTSARVAMVPFLLMSLVIPCLSLLETWWSPAVAASSDSKSGLDSHRQDIMNPLSGDVSTG
jgi:hypothetical protein